MRLSSHQLIARAHAAKLVVPGFNVPYLPIMAPIIQALRDCRCVGLVMVARLELYKFEARSLKAVRDEYERLKDERFTRLHLDHVPVIDEDNVRVDYVRDISEAIDLGYESVMVDGSRLNLADNIAATRKVVDLAHAKNVPMEAELGAVMGHESGPMPSYEELFASGKGFTDVAEAQRFVRETGADWLSVAVGNVHGAISKARKDQKKVEARLNVAQIERIAESTRVPLVLHGGSGIGKSYIIDGIARGIAKINVATSIRQPYERAIGTSVEAAQQAAYDAACQVLREELEIAGSADKLMA